MGLASLELFTDYNLLGVTFFIITLYCLATLNHGYWASKGVPFSRPIPLFGNAYRYITMKATAFEVQQELYLKHKGSPFCGFYELFRPVLMVRDPGLTEQITIKDFGVWMDRGEKIDPKVDPLANHLVHLMGERWKGLRSKLTPVFSSGKLKSMLGQISECTDSMLALLRSDVSRGEPLEMKKVMSVFTLDVIGSCAFGLELNVLKTPDSTFIKMGQLIFEPSTLGKLKRLIRVNFPAVVSLFNLKSMPKEIENFFIDLVKNTIKHREENNIQRNDFIQLMMAIRRQKEQQDHTTDEVVLDDVTFAANAFAFLIAGYDTTATTLSYLIYELSKKPDIQEKLYNEIQEVLKKHKGEINWESLNDLTYLEQCICETLRKDPPVGAIRRLSIQSYRIPNSSIELPAGSSVLIPVYALHHDPQYFPDPEKFIPERFSQENKDNLIKGSYLPFGNGPRICIGLRFAKVEMKIAMLKLISNFTFKLNPKTLDPIQFSPSALLSVPIGGIWVDCKPRKEYTI